VLAAHVPARAMVGQEVAPEPTLAGPCDGSVGHAPAMTGAPSARNPQTPTNALVGAVTVPAAISHQSTPQAIQYEPHMPCMAVASPSRASNAHMPATNWAKPPKKGGKGEQKVWVLLLCRPYKV
jgi:hypothetical protein